VRKELHVVLEGAQGCHRIQCGGSRYVKVRNEDGDSVTTKVVIKQLRYMPIMPRLKQLFLSKETMKQMRWHKEGKRETEDPDIMSHPADSEAWQTLDRFDPEFARDPRSVRLVLSMDGFQPHSNDSHLYSCWPVFMMPYNLPPDKCLKEGFIFLALVVPGPRELKKQMNIFLQSLFKELKKLWQGVEAYDSHLRCRFTLRASYLWSINDYLGYGKFVDCCVHGWLNCPICMDDSYAYRLQHSKKATFFDCHRRFLPLSLPVGTGIGRLLMLWGPPTGGGYWPPPPQHLTLPLQPGPEQWTPQQL
jgi:hypothetical protein